jgi:hypothetical protein
MFLLQSDHIEQGRSMEKRHDVGSITDVVVDEENDRLLVPAADVVGLMRGVAAAFSSMAEERSEADRATLLGVAQSMRGLADQLDVFFIEEQSDNTIWFRDDL